MRQRAGRGFRQDVPHAHRPPRCPVSAERSGAGWLGLAGFGFDERGVGRAAHPNSQGVESSIRPRQAGFGANMVRLAGLSKPRANGSSPSIMGRTASSLAAKLRAGENQGKMNSRLSSASASSLTPLRLSLCPAHYSLKLAVASGARLQLTRITIAMQVMAVPHSVPTALVSSNFGAPTWIG
jgi:hypothetical protein